MKKLIVSALGLLVLLTGCGLQNNTNDNSQGNHTVINAYVLPNKTSIWVKVWSTNSPNKYYVVTKDRVSKVGKQFAVINDPNSQGSAGVQSNSLPVGTKLFTIPGYTATQSIAIQKKDGSFVRALYAGSKQP